MQPLIFIVGPTAVGKSECAWVLAKRINAEIICCDAMQVYREIMIASDKPIGLCREIPHHLVDIISVTQDFNVAVFRDRALDAIGDIEARGKTPLIVGGSGLYMSVLLDGILEKSSDKALRLKLYKALEDHGSRVLHEELKKLDPETAMRIHPQDSQRIIRALEVIQLTGEPLSALQTKREGLWGKKPIKLFCLNRAREEIYQRLESRIEAMFAKGLLDEIKGLQGLRLSQTAGKMIGIPEVMGYLKGGYDMERAKYLMKLHTRHYVKRQLTWFRGDDRLTWINIQPHQSAQDIADVMASSG